MTAVYTDQKGNVLTPGTTVIAVAVRDHSNLPRLVVGIGSGPYTDNGQTYLAVPWKTGVENARAVLTMADGGNGQALNAVVYNAT